MDKDKNNNRIKIVNFNKINIKKAKILKEKSYRKIEIDKHDANIQYFLYFLEKYSNANNYTFRKDDLSIIEFREWVQKYIVLTENYKAFLEAYEIDTDEPNVAELGKGKFDSIIGANNYEISEFAETMKKPKLEIVNPYKGILLYQERKKITLDDLGIDTMITQNPNDLNIIETLSIISNYLQKNIIFGVYGSFNDKDAEKKAKMIRKILKEIDNTVFNYDTDKDNFFMLVQSKKINRRKI